MPKDENPIPPDFCSNQEWRTPQMSSNLWMLCDILICYLICFTLWDYVQKKGQYFSGLLLVLLIIWSNRIGISIFISKAWTPLWNIQSEIWISSLRENMAWWFMQTFFLEIYQSVSVIKENYIKWDSKLGSIESLSIQLL